MNSTLLRRGLAALCICAATTVLAMPGWETGSYIPADWTAPSTNLLAGGTATASLSYYNEGGKDMAQNLAGGAAAAMAALTDGEVPGATVDYNKIVGISGGEISWALNTPINLDSLAIFSRWGDGGRDGIAIAKVQVLPYGSDQWMDIDTTGVSYGLGNNDTAANLYARLVDPEGPLATSVSGVKIFFSSNQDNGGSGYVEVEAVGSVVGDLRISVAPTAAITVISLDIAVESLDSDDTGDLYLAFGQDPGALAPALVATGLEEGDVHHASFGDLAPFTIYYYSAYLVVGEDQSAVCSGAVRTLKDLYRGLPSRYTQLEFVTTTGSQCLNTGVKAGATIGATMDFIPLAYTGDGNLGTMAGGDSSDWRFFNYSGGSMFDIGGARIGYTASPYLILDNSTRYIVEVGNASLSISLEDGTPVWSGAGAVQAAASIYSADIYLSALGNANGYQSATPMTIYSLEMTDNAQVIRDFVPCYDTVDECHGLYDMANYEFYPFIGSDLGAIVAGPIVAKPDTPMALVDIAEANPWDVLLVATVTNDGDSGQDLACDLYFASGESDAILTPVKIAEGLHLGDSFRIAISNLNDSTTYTYSYYVVNGLGVRQAQTRGGFTTAYALPATVEASLAYCTATSAVIRAEITTFGQDATSADLYFAIGNNPANLSPAIYLADAPLEEAIPVGADGLAAGMTYYWKMYAINDLDHRGPAVSGSFQTLSPLEAPQWTGAIDSSWSQPGNWEPATTFTDGETVANVALNSFPGGNPPSDYDVDITIGRIFADRNMATPFAISGNQMRFNYYQADPAATGSITFDNDVQFTRVARDDVELNMRETSLVFNGVVSDDGRLSFVSSDNYGQVSFRNPGNTFTLPINMHLGTLHVTGDAQLGVVDPAKVAETGYGLNNNWGAISFENEEGKHYNLIRLDPARTLAGPFNVANETTDLFFDGEFKMGGGNGDLEIGGDRTKRGFVRMGGALGDVKGHTVIVKNGIVAVAESDTAFGCETNPAPLRTYFGTFDFNGRDSWNTFYNYTEASSDPAFINNDLAHPSTFRGTMAMDLCQETPLFGGAGAIIHTGGVVRHRNDDYEYFKKGDIGTLTLAGPDYSVLDYATSRLLGGTMVFDYRAYDTPRFPGNGDAYLSNCHLVFLGNDSSRTSVALGSLIQSGDGMSIIETVPGAAGMDFSIGNISQATGSRMVDFRFGAGTAVSVSGEAMQNQTGFPGLGAGVTIGGGRNWAYFDSANATIAALPASLMSDGAIEDDSVANLTGSSYVLGARKQPYAIRFANTSGPVTLTLDATLAMGTHGGGNTCAFLVSPDSAGDVTIEGSGAINNTWANCTMLFHNYLPTNHTFAIHALIDNPNNNSVSFIGPGVTLLDNDRNNFYNGPHAYGGQTIRFTSMSNSGTSCSLGGGYNNEMRMFCANATYEYVGTAPEGHSGNRRFQLRGPVTVKANGAGPIRFNNEYFATSEFASNIVTLDGEGEGIIDGAIQPGNYGRLVKQGDGTWTINSTDSVFLYGTEIKAGTLVLNGALPSDVVVRSGAKLVLGPGAVLKRGLVVEEGATVEVDPTAEVPATVWGRASLAGSLALSARMPQGPDIPLLVTENGIEGAFNAVPSNLAVTVEDGAVSAHTRGGTMILIL